MADDDHSGWEFEEISASFMVTFEIIVLLSFLPVVFFDFRIHNINRSRDAKRTKQLMVAVFISNIAFQVIHILSTTACFDCNIMWQVLWNTRIVMKGINLMFLLHRANLVQGMSPILSKVWFEKIFPVVVILYVLGSMVVSTRIVARLEMECYLYTDSDELGMCFKSDPKEPFPEQYIAGMWFMISMEALIGTCLMVLFVVPLYRVSQLDLGQMNANQLRQRKKLKRLLVWSVMMTFANQTSGTATLLVPAVNMNPYPLLYFLIVCIGLFDPSINVWTSWLMVNRNRHHLQKLCCCGRRVNDRNLIHSHGIHGPRLQSKSTIELSNIEITETIQRNSLASS